MGVSCQKNCLMSGRTERGGDGAEGSGEGGRREERVKGSLVCFRLSEETGN